ncbi:MAE_28990/MAE_18760 family HEPN-like nuclease [Microcystis sp. LEGE 08355]|uniref:MAE_28990/MAE_18760 family HEPN-like nuclease n=1 Tax=Microcystis sp. LEGE 08355 TaxID=1828687 RepID=UPI0021070A1C|nr:MAE_28990/MAE_18760 family HEPN-like nuclease [Microcystis sp. LEGE 08355]
MIKNLLDNLENRAFIPHENIINTKSNLNFEVFTDICTILGIDDSDYQLRQKAIDEQLLTQRNKIAHGKYLTRDEVTNRSNLSFVSAKFLSSVSRCKL